MENTIYNQRHNNTKIHNGTLFCKWELNLFDKGLITNYKSIFLDYEIKFFVRHFLNRKEILIHIGLFFQNNIKEEVFFDNFSDMSNRVVSTYSQAKKLKESFNE